MYAFEYLKTNRLETEDKYPYTGKDDKCHYDESSGVVEVERYQAVQKASPKSFIQKLQSGPISIALDGTAYDF